MNTKTKKIDVINRLEKRINAWSRVAELAKRISRFADAKCYGYTYEQNILIDEVKSTRESIDLRAKEEYNRRHFKIETDL